MFLTTSAGCVLILKQGDFEKDVVVLNGAVLPAQGHS